MHRIPVGDAPTSLRAADPGGVVADECRMEAGKAGRDELGSAGKAGEEVRLGEAGDHAHVGLDPEPVEPHRYAGAVATHPDERRLVARVVVDHRYGVDDGV